MTEYERMKEELKSELLAEIEAQKEEKKRPECLKFACEEYVNEGGKLNKMFGPYKAHKIYGDVRDIVRIMYGHSTCIGLRTNNQDVAKRMFEIIFNAVMLAESERKELESE